MSEPCAYRSDLESLLAMVEADFDLFPQEVDDLLHWVIAFARLRLVEMGAFWSALESGER